MIVGLHSRESVRQGLYADGVLVTAMRAGVTIPVLTALIIFFAACISSPEPAGALGNQSSGMSWISGAVKIHDYGNNTTRTGFGMREAVIAISPMNPDLMVVAAIDEATVYSWNHLWRSEDGGRIWIDEGLFEYPPTNATAKLSGDPSIVFDSKGNAIIASLAFWDNGQDCGVAGIFIQTSSDGGKTWTQTGNTAVPDCDRATKRCIVTDKEHLGVDPISDRLYLSYSRITVRNCDYSNPEPLLPGHAGTVVAGDVDFAVVLTYSDDHGATWTEAQELRAPVLDVARYQHGSIARVASDGTIHVAFFSGEATPAGAAACPHPLGLLWKQPFGTIVIMSSKDQAKTWTTHLVPMCSTMTVALATGALPAPVADPTATAGVPFADVMPHMDVDPATNAVYVTYASVLPEERLAAVQLVSSSDGGASWSMPQVLSTVAPGRHAWYPTVAADQGVVTVVFQQRSGSGDAHFVMWTQSRDGGKSWSDAKPFSDEIYSGGQIGDYNWLDSSGGVIAASWAAMQDGPSEIWVRAGPSSAAPS